MNDFTQFSAVLNYATSRLNEIRDRINSTPGYMAVAGLRDCGRAVDAFHKKNKVSAAQSLLECDSPAVDGTLEHAAATLSTVAQEMLGANLANDDKDRRLLRAHLIVEECGELLSAMSSRNEVGTLDAMCDLLYVLIGTAVTLDLPIGEGFVEVHTSNMSKQRQETDPHGARVRDKGPDYVPPNLQKVLDTYRGSQARPHTMIGDYITGECKHCGMSWQQVRKQIVKYGKVTCKGGK